MLPTLLDASRRDVNRYTCCVVQMISVPNEQWVRHRRLTVRYRVWTPLKPDGQAEGSLRPIGGMTFVSRKVGSDFAYILLLTVLTGKLPLGASCIGNQARLFCLCTGRQALMSACPRCHKVHPPVARTLRTVEQNASCCRWVNTTALPSRHLPSQLTPLLIAVSAGCVYCT